MRRASSPFALFTSRFLVVLPSVALFTLPLVAESAGATVSLPAMPAYLGTKDPCTAASKQTATAASWAQQSLTLPRAWQLTRGAGVTVGVVDTGVATGATALSGRVTAVGAAGEDCVGHGSFVAGLVAAGPTGSTAFEGVAPEARILAVRGTDERGKATAGRVADGIRAAVDGGAGVVTVSAALTGGGDELTAAVAYATRHDVLVVAPAAPDVSSTSSTSGTPSASSTSGTSDTSDAGAAAARYWPAAAEGALSVVGVSESGAALESASGATGAALAAPGGAVVGIGARGSGHYLGAGSSLAAAFVAGTAALVRAYQPKLTAAQVAERLTASATPAEPAPRLDPYGAVTMVTPTSPGTDRAGAAEPVRIVLPSEEPERRALWVGGVVLSVVVLVAGALVVVPRGRARGWRP